MILKNTNAQIHLKSETDNDGEVTEMEVIEDARYEYKNGKYYIIYEETGFSEMRGCTTMIKVEPSGCVWVKRSGALETSMCYEAGKSHSSVYSFDFGSLTMETHTKSVNMSLTPSCGELDMVYTLDMGAARSENHLNIRVKDVIIKDLSLKKGFNSAKDFSLKEDLSSEEKENSEGEKE